MSQSTLASLELVSTEDLIEELFQRTTFAGVIVYSPANHRYSGQCHDNFCLRTTADEDSTLFLLEKGIESFKNRDKDDQL